MSTTGPGPRRAAPAGDVDTRTPEPWEVAESPRRPRNNGELALSTVLVLLGVYLVVGAGGITVPGSSNTVGPRFFPYLVGAATIVVGGLLALRVLRGDQGPEEAGEDVLSSPGNEEEEIFVAQIKKRMAQKMCIRAARPQHGFRPRKGSYNFVGGLS